MPRPHSNPNHPLARLRRAKGLTQPQLAQAARVAQGTISQIERGEGPRHYSDAAHKLARFFQERVEYVLGHELERDHRPRLPPRYPPGTWLEDILWNDPSA